MSNFFNFFTTIGHPNEEFLKQLNSVFQKKEFKNLTPVNFNHIPGMYFC